MPKRTYEIVLKEDRDDGGYVAIVPSLPGCISDGDTKDEALKNIRDAIKLYEQSISVQTKNFSSLAKNKEQGIEVLSICI